MKTPHAGLVFLLIGAAVLAAGRAGVVAQDRAGPLPASGVGLANGNA
jgi:hypothetical protein